MVADIFDLSQQGKYRWGPNGSGLLSNGESEELCTRGEMQNGEMGEVFLHFGILVHSYCGTVKSQSE